MSRTQVSDLICDFEDEFIIGGSGGYIPEKLDSKRLTEISDIEIVPRKMVEMIIEECERNRIINDKYGNYCAGDNLNYIKKYAESLLKQFEGDIE